MNEPKRSIKRIKHAEIKHMQTNSKCNLHENELSHRILSKEIALPFLSQITSNSNLPPSGICLCLFSLTLYEFTFPSIIVSLCVCVRECLENRAENRAIDDKIPL